MNTLIMKTLFNKVLGKEKGLLSLISEKTGKISFKRVGGIMIIAYITKQVPPQELTVMHTILLIASLTSVLLPKIIAKDEKK